MCLKSFFNKIMSSKNKNTTDASGALISTVELEKVIQETMQNTLKERREVLVRQVMSSECLTTLSGLYQEVCSLTLRNLKKKMVMCI